MREGRDSGMQCSATLFSGYVYYLSGILSKRRHEVWGWREENGGYGWI